MCNREVVLKKKKYIVQTDQPCIPIEYYTLPPNLTRYRVMSSSDEGSNYFQADAP